MIYDDDIVRIKPGTALFDKLGKRSMIVFKTEANEKRYRDFYVFYTSHVTKKGRYAVVGELDLKSYFDVIVL